MKFLLSLALALGTTCAAASAAGQSSLAKIAFGPGATLFAADWRAGRIYAYTLPPAVRETRRAFNLLDLQAPLARAVGTPRFTIRDFAMRPGTAEAYVALESGARGTPALVRVTPSGRVTKLDLAALPASSTALERAGGDLTFWAGVPERAYTVTDMKWHAGRLYVAGLANQDFSSTLRVLAYPFGRRAMTSIEMYHTLHDQIETRAPIRAMTFATIGGTDTLLAAYLCSPLVAVPVARLVDGAHVRAKTLAELGVAGIPQNMIAYDQPDLRGGPARPFVLVVERYRPSIAIPLAGIAREAAGPGLTHPPDPTAPAARNVGGAVQDYDGALRIDDQDATFFVALRRDLESGAPQLVSYDKRAAFRLSDADVSDYDFPAYRYRGAFQTKFILPLQNTLKREEGFGNLVVRP